MQIANLAGKKGLIIGIANDQSIAYGCARVMHTQGAEVAITYLNEKSRPYVQPLAEELEAPIFLPCDVSDDTQLDHVFDEIEKKWGKIDFMIHSIAFAPLNDLHARLVDSSREGFLTAMDISCHSFLRMAQRAERIMPDGGSLFAMTYYGAGKVVKNYDLMGPVKAALESSVRYLAYELGEKNIRVHAISPGPIATRAASGLKDFDELIESNLAHSAMKGPLGINDVGALVAFLASDAANAMTGDTLYVDEGHHILDT